MTSSPSNLDTGRPEPLSGWVSIANLLTAPALLLAGIWAILFAIHTALPYIRAGADVILAAKVQAIRTAGLFRREAPIRVAVFGNSKTLSGFQPRLFDELSGAVASSYNFGQPALLSFTGLLEQLCERGECPTHALLLFPWPDSEATSPDLLHPAIDDRAWMETLFPFRNLPRDALIFAVRATGKGGVAAAYEEARRQANLMLSDRGYYFIEGQSNYPGHRLPDDFRLRSDDPGRSFARSASFQAPEFRRMRELMTRYGVAVHFVPAYFREGEFAPPDASSPLAQSLREYPGISMRGPEYWLFPNRQFSDALHLNPGGAGTYTRRLWELLGPELEQAARDIRRTGRP